MLFFPLQKIGKLLPEIQESIRREVHPIRHFRFIEQDIEEAARPDFDDSGWAEFTIPGYWGGYDVEAWFRTTIEIPQHLRDKRLALRFLVGPRDGGHSTAETMLFVNGEPLQGIDIWHEEAWLPPEVVEQGRVSIALHAWSGVLGVPERRQFKLAQLVWIDKAAERFFFLADTLRQAVKEMDEDDLRRVRLLDCLNQSFQYIDFTQPNSEGFYDSLAEAERFLSGAVEEMARLEEMKPTVVGIGHAHIDMAWLWRLSHSRDKAGRTFATALHLMRQYPDYRFIHSSPQLYKFLQQDYPSIFERVKERIASGEWEITGAMWIESDTNLVSGESLIRQFLFGKRYIRQEFGVESYLLWLPDVFGYSWALPQIIRKCGVKYFLTSKISWNQFNRFPHDTFMWRGIDGTEVLTHFVTTPEQNSTIYTYNGTLSPGDVTGIWENYRQKEVNDELLLLFGWGDGGGGPTQQMLEYARAMKNLPGIPRVTMGRSEPYFERLAERVADQELPLWDGELYLEYHRGTYTSQAQVKKANRKSEILYHDAEWLSALAEMLADAPYPRERLNEGWEMILLNQFHDILPGSSIHEVYEDAAKEYEQILSIGEAALEQAQSALLGRIAADEPGVAVFNSLPWARDGLIALPYSEGSASQGASSQVVEEDGQRKVLRRVRQVPSLGYSTYALAEQESDEPESLVVTPARLENSFYRLTLNEQGQITSLFDKRHEREVLAEGARGNVFQAFEDKPMAFDAWDIDLYYQEKMKEVNDLVGAWVEETGPLRGVLRLQWRFYDSTITQWLTLYAHSPRIDFRTEIDWREKQVLLKAAFPVAVRSTRATYEIQFGSIERPTHWNTSWDYARFEVPGQKWADLSEGNYGVALLNDCKYGHDIKNNVMRLTLLKSAIRPDAEADKGLHRFTYSLLPHEGGWQEGGVVQEAYALNYPLLAREIPAQPNGTLPARYAFVTVPDEVILETVKKAEDEDAYIIRLYEWRQARHNGVTLRFARPIRRAAECNMIEEEERPIDHEGDQLTFPITPYEVKTFKIWF
jgi:alpha-mannosidase